MHGGLTVTTKADHMDQFRSEMLKINALSYLAVLHIKTSGEVSAKGKRRRKIIFSHQDNKINPLPSHQYFYLSKMEPML